MFGELKWSMFEMQGDCWIGVNNSTGTSGWRCSWSPLGGRLATTFVATKNVFIFFFSFLFFFFLRRQLFS